MLQAQSGQTCCKGHEKGSGGRGEGTVEDKGHLSVFISTDN